MSGLTGPSSLLRSFSAIQQVPSFPPALTLMIRKVLLIAILTFGAKVVIKKIVQSFLNQAAPAPTLPIVPHCENHNKPQIIEVKLGEEFPLFNLPNDLIVYVFSFLSPRDLLDTGSTSKDFYQLCIRVDIAWESLVSRHWAISLKEAEKSWKKVYQENYEGPLTELTESCKVQNFEGVLHNIPFGKRSRVFHLKRKIRQSYKLQPDDRITLVIVDKVFQDNSWVRDIAYCQISDGSGSSQQKASTINFTVSVSPSTSVTL